jgi:rsbT co-antagonist protein RsbR
MAEELASTHFEALMRAMPVGLFVIVNASIVWCNEAFRELREGPIEGIVGHNFVELVAPEDRAFVVDRYRRRLAGEDVPDHYEFSLLGVVTGNRRPIHMLVKVVEAGGTRHSVGVIVDVSGSARAAGEIVAGAGEQVVLTAPVLRVAAGVLVVPMIGHFHAARVHGLMQDLLAAIQREQAHTLILDVTGLIDADARVAEHLARAAAATRLLGARTLLAGVTPALAVALVSASSDLAGLTTAATLEARCGWPGRGDRRGREADPHGSSRCTRTSAIACSAGMPAAMCRPTADVRGSQAISASPSSTWLARARYTKSASRSRSWPSASG